MPKNQVTDPITDQEIPFARPVLSGTMTDHCAAGPPVSTPKPPHTPKLSLVATRRSIGPLCNNNSSRYTTEPRRFTVTRDQVLTRLWEIAAIGPEITRGSLAGQVKALSMIAAIEGLIPGRRAASGQNQPAPPQVTADIYESEWLRARRTGDTVEPSPAVPQEEPASKPSSGSAPPTQEPTHAPTPSSAPRVPMADHVAPDTRVPFSIKPWRR